MKLILLSLVFLVSCGLFTQKSPDEVKADQLYTLGNDKMLEKDFETARDLFSKASKLTPNDPRIIHNLGMTYLFKKDIKKGLEYLEKTLILDENSTEALRNLSSINYQLGKYLEAKKYYLRLVKNSEFKKDFQAHSNLAYIYRREDNYLEAKKHLMIIANNNKDNCITHSRIGKIEQELKNHQLALDHFNKSLYPPCYLNPEAMYLKGLVLERLGRYSDARKTYGELTKKFPTTFFNSFAQLRQAQIKKRKDRKRL